MAERSSSTKRPRLWQETHHQNRQPPAQPQRHPNPDGTSQATLSTSLEASRPNTSASAPTRKPPTPNDGPAYQTIQIYKIYNSSGVKQQHSTICQISIIKHNSPQYKASSVVIYLSMSQIQRYMDQSITLHLRVCPTSSLQTHFIQYYKALLLIFPFSLQHEIMQMSIIIRLIS